MVRQRATLTENQRSLFSVTAKDIAGFAGLAMAESEGIVSGELLKDFSCTNSSRCVAGLIVFRYVIFSTLHHTCRSSPNPKGSPGIIH